MISFFPIINFLCIINNIPASPAYGVYISQLVHYSRTCAYASTVILWTELNCWRKSNSNKTTLLLGWSHRYKNPTVVITILLTITKYPYLKWQWIFYFLHRCFLSSITANTFTGLDCIYKKQELLTPRKHLSSPLVRFLWGPCCSSF